MKYPFMCRIIFRNSFVGKGTDNKRINAYAFGSVLSSPIGYVYIFGSGYTYAYVTVEYT